MSTTSGIGYGYIVPTEMTGLHLVTAVSCRIMITKQQMAYHQNDKLVEKKIGRE